jgi:hypothetical protein
VGRAGLTVYVLELNVAKQTQRLLLWATHKTKFLRVALSHPLAGYTNAGVACGVLTVWAGLSWPALLALPYVAGCCWSLWSWSRASAASRADGPVRALLIYTGAVAWIDWVLRNLGFRGTGFCFIHST